MSAAVTVLRPGLLTTVQDLGRWGHQDTGVPVAGPMDLFSHRWANALAGNAPDAATLEITLVGPELRAESAITVALAGAVFDVELDGRPCDVQRPLAMSAGSRLRFGERRRGARAYLAVAGGGVLTAPVLGSRATHLVSAMGGVAGRALAAGDRVAVAAAPAGPSRAAAGADWLPRGTATVRVLMGPQEDWFSAETRERFATEPFTITNRSNRMGYRLAGPSIHASRRDELLSEPVAFGAIQVPAGGDPILLMADRQTAGGYPKIATVIGADLPLAGQLAPGDTIRFQPCTRADAVAALIARERELLRVLPEGA